jgi:non-specific serine/threonine protein kinase
MSTPSSAIPLDTTSAAKSAQSVGAVRMFGRYQLMRLLGKSDRSMAWLATDSTDQQDYMLVMPRKQPEADALQAWRLSVKRAARLVHPHLAHAVEMGEHERWPYVAYDRGEWVTWAERLSTKGEPATELAHWAAQIAQGLAFAHEAGLAHHDLQPWLLVVGPDNRAAVLGLEVAGNKAASMAEGAIEAVKVVRQVAEVDVLALSLVMYHALVGQPALDEYDVAKVMARMLPQGRDIVRLPWAVPRPIPDALRAIVNRATDRQPRQRYRNARTLQRALEGWLRTESDSNGPLALLLDRLRTVGVLPAQPGGAERAARLALMEGCRTSELAEVVLGDMALSFELLRMVNSAKVHGEQVSSDGPVLMLRRAIAMLGLEGVRRAALSLRPWPGPMNPAAEQEMSTLIRRVQRAARVAVRLAPPGYDPEVITLITMMQNLGRLVVQYHFPEESAQIRRLMQAADSGQPAAKPEPGMTADAAAFAVLGVTVDALGMAVAQHWGLDSSVQQMMRRQPADAALRHLDGDNDILRATASCANDLVDALSLPARQNAAALKAVTQHYARALGLGMDDLHNALQQELQPASQDIAATVRPGGAGPAPVLASSATAATAAARTA